MTKGGQKNFPKLINRPEFEARASIATKVYEWYSAEANGARNKEIRDDLPVFMGMSVSTGRINAYMQYRAPTTL